MHKITTSPEFKKIINKHQAVLAYFSHEQCNICRVLKPKIENYFSKKYPKLFLVYINTIKFPKLTAQYSVFTVPVVIIFFETKEFYRRNRNFSIAELDQLVNRPYNLLLN